MLEWADKINVLSKTYPIQVQGIFLNDSQIHGRTSKLETWKMIETKEWETKKEKKKKKKAKIWFSTNNKIKKKRKSWQQSLSACNSK